MLPDTFWANVDIGVCWVWQRYTDKDGYGMGWNGAEVGLVHRLVWADLVGEIPKGLHLDHLCRNRRCCNPDHLEVVTPKTNARRRPKFGNALKTHCKRGHEFTDSNTYRSEGRRVCITCRRQESRRRYHDKSRGQ